MSFEAVLFVLVISVNWLASSIMATSLLMPLFIMPRTCTEVVTESFKLNGASFFETMVLVSPEGVILFSVKPTESFVDLPRLYTFTLTEKEESATEINEGLTSI